MTPLLAQILAGYSIVQLIIMIIIGAAVGIMLVALRAMHETEKKVERLLANQEERKRQHAQQPPRESPE